MGRCDRRGGPFSFSPKPPTVGIVTITLSMRLHPSAALGALAAVLAACRSGGDEAVLPGMRVVRAQPGTDAPDVPARLFLNQDVTVYFSEPVDPLSVTADTFRIVDQSGLGVDGRLRVGTRSITFEPIPPVKASLDDGSLRPGRDYVLEVAGLPLWNAVRSTNGQRLERGFSLRLRTVAADPRAEGFSSPFLPVGTGVEAFAVQGGHGLRVAADTGRLRLQFNLPVLPTSASPDAVQVWRLYPGRAEPELLAVSEVTAVAEAPGHAPYGSVVEVRITPGVLRPADLVYVTFPRDGAAQFRDYLGWPLAATDAVLSFSVQPGDRVRLLQLGGREPWHFEPGSGELIPFAAREDGRAEPLCHRDAGSGAFGVFRPSRDVVLTPHEPVDRGDGTRVVSADGDFPFQAIDVPDGVTVVVRSPTPVTLRARGGIRIRGRLVLDVPTVEHRWAQGASVPIEGLLAGAPCALVAGGDVRVEGRVELADPRAEGTALTIVAGGGLIASGRLPPHVVVTLGRDRIEGAVESPLRDNSRDRLSTTSPFTPGLPAGLTAPAEAWTAWQKLPADGPDEVEVVVDDVVGSVDIAVQVAAPDPVLTSRPEVEAHVLREPVTIAPGIPQAVHAGGFVRFRLRAVVEGGRPLPSVGAIRVLAH
jgi:hypothetical protein